MKSGWLSARNRMRAGVFPSCKTDPMYDDPKRTYDNTIFPHSPLRLHGSVDQAVIDLQRPRHETSSPYVFILAAPDKPRECKFRLFDSPTTVGGIQALLSPFNEQEDDPHSPVAHWQTVSIPSVWQLHPNKVLTDVNDQYKVQRTDNDDPPMYTNMAYPWKAKNNSSFNVPTKNPTAVYRIPFNIPAAWLGQDGDLLPNREARLLFHGGGSGLEIHLNGTYLGYGQDSMTETEVLIPSALLNPQGENLLAVVCYKFTDGSYLEDQDQWWFSGLFRSIELQFINSHPVTILDYSLTTLTPSEFSSLNDTPSTTATVTAQVLLRSPLFSEDTEQQDLDINTIPVAKDEHQDENPRKRARTKVHQGIIFDDKNLRTKKSLSIVNYRQSMAVDAPPPDLSQLPHSLIISVFTRNGTRVALDVVNFEYVEGNLLNTDKPREKKLQMTLEIPNAHLWNVDDPYLYTVVLELRHRTEQRNYLLQCESARVGVRSVDIFNGQVRVNGAPVLICGVNRHEFCPQQGKVMTEELIQNDLRLIKRLNFNAVRCSHYPNVHRFYELCDEIGLFVVDEANVETHGMALAYSMSILQHSPQFQKQIQQRIKSMYLRAKNYTCIIGWSLGNEAGSGPHLRKVVDWIHEQEQYFENNIHLLQRSSASVNELYRGRFIQYEGGVASGDAPLVAGDGQDPFLTEIICPMYFTPKECLIALRKDNRRVKILKSKLGPPKLSRWKQEISKISRAKFRPFILCEYAHAMGNSNGNLHNYWKLFKSKDYLQFQGGFIWDFVDQGISLANANIDFTEIYPALMGQDNDAHRKFGYGGSFGPNSGVADTNFCINGLVLPDRELKPGAREAKYLQQPIDFKLETIIGEKSCFLLTALLRPHSLDLKDVGFEWKIFDESHTEAIAVESFSSKRTTRNKPSIVFGLTKAFIAFKTALIKYREKAKMDNFSLEVTAKSVTCPSLPPGHVIARESFSLGEYFSDDDLEEEIQVTQPSPKQANFSYDQDGGRYNIDSMEYVATFDTTLGELVSMTTHSKMPIIEEEAPGLRYSFYRAPTDNDNGGADTLVDNIITKMASKANPKAFRAISTPWKQLGLDELIEQLVLCEVVENTGDLTITVHKRHLHKKALRFSTTTTYIFLPSKLSVVFEVLADKSLNGVQSLPRIGTTFRLPHLYNFCNYLGRGPYENYADRKSSTPHRVHSNRIQEWNVPYIKPSESGGRCDVKWVEFTHEESSMGAPDFRVSYRDNFIESDLEGPTLPSREEVFPGITKREISAQAEILMREQEDNNQAGFRKLYEVVKEDVAFRGEIGDRPAGMNGCQLSISSFSIEEVERAKHDFDLPLLDEEERPFVNLDCAHMGVGGDTSWLPHIHEQYRIKGKSWKWMLDFEPLKADLSFFASLKNNLKGLYRSSFMRSSRPSRGMSEVTGMIRRGSRVTTKTKY